ncbi:hypothetical protein KL925_003775 [Ogataea polymorpha]|nr:hypothetical protein KL925_003775 [Ogataea polymorpha]
MFRVDWQTVQIGVPFSSVIANNRVYCLTDQNIYSVLSSTTGDVLYRYQSATPIDEDSILCPAWDGIVVTGMNHGLLSRVIFWTIDGLIEHEFETGSIAGIHNIRDESLLIVHKDGSVTEIDRKLQQKPIASVGDVVSSKIAYFVDQVVLITKNESGAVSYWVLEGASGSLVCDFSQILLTDDGIVCNKDVYKLENGKLQRQKNTKFAPALAGSTHARVASSQFLVTVGEKVNIYDLDEPTSPISSFSLDSRPDLFEAATIGDSLNVFVVSGNDVLLYADGELKWARDESLAQIKDIEVIDRHERLAVTAEDFEREKHWSGYVGRTKHNIRLLLDSAPSESDKHFGFNKTILVLTTNGNIYGFDSYGHHEWSIKGHGFTKIFKVDNQAYAVNDHVFCVTDGRLSETDVQHEAEALYPPNLDTSYRLLQAASRRYNNSEVASPAVVLENRRALYKYLNPFTAVAAFYNDDERVVKFVVYNKATNQTYSSFTHRTENPDSLKLFIEENFIIFTTTEKNAETSICGVIELYESLVPDRRSKVPEHQVRTYILPAPVSAMTITRTKHNVSSKWVIVALESGEIVALPQALVNARRPFNTSKQKTERTPMKYQPVLPLNPKLTLSHYRKILGTQKLVSVPTELESTTLVVGSGTGLFATLVRPSSSFDSMKGDFNKNALMATMALLVLSILLVRPLVSQKRVKDTWQTRI